MIVAVTQVAVQNSAYRPARRHLYDRYLSRLRTPRRPLLGSGFVQSSSGLKMWPAEHSAQMAMLDVMSPRGSGSRRSG